VTRYLYRQSGPGRNHGSDTGEHSNWLFLRRTYEWIAVETALALRTELAASCSLSMSTSRAKRRRPPRRCRFRCTAWHTYGVKHTRARMSLQARRYLVAI